MSFEENTNCRVVKKRGFAISLLANPFFTRQCLFKRNIFLFSRFSNLYCISVIVLFLVWLFICLLFVHFVCIIFVFACLSSVERSDTDLYQDKHTFKCHFSKLSVFIYHFTLYILKMIYNYLCFANSKIYI